MLNAIAIRGCVGRCEKMRTAPCGNERILHEAGNGRPKNACSAVVFARKDAKHCSLSRLMSGHVRGGWGGARPSRGCEWRNVLSVSAAFQSDFRADETLWRSLGVLGIKRWGAWRGLCGCGMREKSFWGEGGDGENMEFGRATLLTQPQTGKMCGRSG